MITEPIIGEFVRLRIATADDAQFTLEARQNDSNTKYMPKLDVSLEQQKKWIERQTDSKDCYFFVIERLNGERIGTFSLYNIEGEKAESGRMIIRGNQMETMEAVLLFHDFAFISSELDTVYSGIEVDNLPAQGVALSVAAKNKGFYDDDKKMYLFVAEREDYLIAREKLQKLVARFAGRQRRN